MEFLDILKSRQSIRKFTSQKVDEEKINKIIEAGRIAPTAYNLQPQKILVINSLEGLTKWQKCTHCHFNEQLVFIICFDKNECWKREFDHKSSGDIDASIVATHMMLEAHLLGIGSTWVMYYVPETLKQEFNIPDNYESTCVLAMGYASSDAPISKGHNNKKEIDKTIFFNQYQ